MTEVAGVTEQKTVTETKSGAETKGLDDSSRLQAFYLSKSGTIVREEIIADIGSIKSLAATKLKPGQDELLLVLLKPELGGQLKKIRNSLVEAAEAAALKVDPLELSYRQERLLLLGSCAVLIAEQSAFTDAVVGIASGIASAGELDNLTTSVASLWINCRSDKKLAGKVGKDEVAHWERVSSLMNETFQARMTYVDLEERTELLGEQLVGGAKKAFAAIVDEIEFEDRMEVLDEKIDVLQDIYELCNDRISEFNYFHKEYVVELWIIVVLIIEIALMAFELLKNR